MPAIKKILVPVDGSISAAKATEHAISLAEKCRAHLDFLYVASEINKDIPNEIIFNEIQKRLPAHIDASQHTTDGKIADAILRTAQALQSDMIIMGSRGLGILRGALIGSVSQKVMEESNIPIMIVK